MKCFVYKSAARADTYIYLRERDAFGLLPEILRQSLGSLSFVLELELSPERRLAQADPGIVMANLRGPGFHLQMPPPKTPDER